jgi:hypothetical protein
MTVVPVVGGVVIDHAERAERLPMAEGEESAEIEETVRAIEPLSDATPHQP